ncbi:MAG: hypothetical protein CSA60_03135 [Neptuniibacter caesariensis]|uniref:Flagellar hook-length control protein-like C-terminal domain-containing protein n=1 Tax=Neptuniibacter caesariensis TaxID=207954 RepID=A0A2G6JMA9_NEPCE|nr:MAG: hypothetical protein CSA60_03135 [Neptuniibacter caesariensis]
MSEQTLSSAAGGTLSLNLSVMPQGAAAGAPGVTPLFGGFSSMLNQQATNTPLSAELDGGMVLPSTGAILPQGAVPESLAAELEQEYMRQQMMQIALLLEQQASSNAEIPAELSAELSRALKEYADQQPVMPLADSALNGTEAPASLVASPLSPVLAPIAAENGVPDEGQIDKQGLQQVAERVAQQAGQASLSVAPEGMEGVTRPIPSVQEQITDVQIRPQMNLVDAGARSGVEAQAQNQVEVLKAGSIVRPDVLPPSGRGREAALAERSMVAGAGLTERQTAAASASVVMGEAGEKRAASQQDSAASAIRPESLASVAKANESLQPLQAMNKQNVPGGLKFESALDMTQQLLQKVATGERADSNVSQLVEKVTGGGSLLTGESQSLAQPSAAQRSVAESQNLMMPQQVRMNTPAWNNALGERAVMIAAQNTRVAEIQLDPPELGSLHVRVNVNQDQVSLSFTSPHAHVRDAVEQSLPRLREMFAEQGLALQDSSVSDHSSDQQGREQLAESSDSGEQYGASGGSDVATESSAEAARPVSLIDYYA